MATTADAENWLKAAGDMSRAMISAAPEDLLDDLVRTAREVSGSDHCALLVPTPEGGLRVALADGAAAAAYLGHVFDSSGQLTPAITRGRGLIVAHISAAAKGVYPPGFDFGPAMLVPLVDSLGVRGALLFVRDEGRLPYADADLDHATTFATQVALGLELSDARTDAESLRVLRDRHRIAKDLHDNVMQRLFAAGLRLQMIDSEDVSDDAEKHLQQHMSELDDTIRQIRTTIFELRESDDVDPISAFHLPPRGGALATDGPEEAQ